MSLIEETLFGKKDKVATAIGRLRLLEPPGGYYAAFSGGKDSVVLEDLLQRAGVKFDLHYSITTVDPPELVHFIREHYPRIETHRPRETMWQLIVRKRMPPTRVVRYCCEVLKEGGGVGRVVVTGIRWEESYNRSKRKMVETCCRYGKRGMVNPIIDWTADDVWEYIHGSGLPYCSLYDEGFKRLGCVGCPCSGKEGMVKEFARWPKIKAAYLRAFAECLRKRRKDGLKTEWTDPEQMMDWWINGSKRGADPDQTTMFG